MKEVTGHFRVHSSGRHKLGALVERLPKVSNCSCLTKMNHLLEIFVQIFPASFFISREKNQSFLEISPLETTTISVVQNENLFISNFSLTPNSNHLSWSFSLQCFSILLHFLSAKSYDNIFAVPHLQTFPPPIHVTDPWQSSHQLPPSKYFSDYTHRVKPKLLSLAIRVLHSLGTIYLTNPTSLPNTWPNLYSLHKRCSRCWDYYRCNRGDRQTELQGSVAMKVLKIRLSDLNCSTKPLQMSLWPAKIHLCSLVSLVHLICKFIIEYITFYSVYFS